MKLDELREPQRISLEFDIRQPVIGVTCGLVLLAGWLLLGRATDSTELLPLPETAQATGAGRSRDNTAALTGGQKSDSGTKAAEEKPAFRQERKGGKGSAPQPVRDPFAVKMPASAPAAGQQRSSTAPQRTPELRLSGIVEAGDSRLAMVSRGSYDLCLAEGETVEGITLLEVGTDYAVLAGPAGAKLLRLTNAAGGGRSRETGNETRTDTRRTADRTGGERRRQR